MVVPSVPDSCFFDISFDTPAVASTVIPCVRRLFGARWWGRSGEPSRTGAARLAAPTVSELRYVMPDYVVIATWPFGRTAVQAAAALLQNGEPALDAAIA